MTGLELPNRPTAAPTRRAGEQAEAPAAEPAGGTPADKAAPATALAAEHPGPEAAEALGAAGPQRADHRPEAPRELPEERRARAVRRAACRPSIARPRCLATRRVPASMPARRRSTQPSGRPSRAARMRSVPTARTVDASATATTGGDAPTTRVSATRIVRRPTEARAAEGRVCVRAKTDLDPTTTFVSTTEIAGPTPTAAAATVRRRSVSAAGTARSSATTATAPPTNAWTTPTARPRRMRIVRGSN
jgi:hypothetical protein